MTRDFSFHQAKPGIEVSVKPRMAQRRLTVVRVTIDLARIVQQGV
jgi:hypothetical protein